MVKLACNYLNELKELLEEKKLTNIDYIKVFSICPRLLGFDWAIKNGYRIMFHGFPDIGSNVGTIDYLENADFTILKEYIERSGTPYLSAHINITGTQKQTELFNGMNDEEYTKKVINTFAYNVNKIREVFKKDMLLEINQMNNNKYNRLCRDPEVINEILEKTGCGLIFDLSHARCMSKMLGITLEEFIDSIDMEKAKEMHVNGVMLYKTGLLKDVHSKLQEEDYIKIEELLIRYPNIETVTLEYGSTQDDMDEETKNKITIVTENGVNSEAKLELYEQIIGLQAIINRVNSGR